MNRPTRELVTWVMILAAACRAPQRASEPVPALPDIPVYVIAPTDSSGVGLAPAPQRDPIGELRADKVVSLSANDADARTLLLWLARQAGVSMVVAPEVTARVSVTFDNVPASEAMRAIIAEAGLSILAPAPRSPWPPVVFRERPANVNEIDADAIVARFGVSLEMAKWLVENRTRP